MSELGRNRLLLIVRVLWCEIALLAVILTGDVSWWLSLLMLVLIPVVGLAPDKSRWLRPLQTLSSLIAIFYLFFFPLDWLVISKQLIFAVVNLIFYLKMHSLLHLQTRKERYRLYVLCLFEMLAAASMTVSLSFLAPLVLFVLVGSLVLILEQSFDPRVPEANRSPLIRPAAGVAFTVGVFVLCLAGVIFVVLPRTSYGGFRVSGLSGITTTGLGGEIRLGDFGEIKLSREVVMRIVDEGDDLVTPPRWRGSAYDRYSEGRWRQSRSGMVLLPRRGPGDFLLDRPSSVSTISHEVYLEPLDTDVMFIPPASSELSVSLPSVFVDPYLTVRTGRSARAGRRYSVRWRPDAPASASSLGGVERLEVWTRQLYLQLPSLSEEFHALARQLPGQSDDPLETAASVETFLETEYRYSLRTPSRGRSDPVEDFLFDARAGHCEFFATAMIMLTRARGIPSRLVTGFRRGKRNEYGDFEVVRKSDAHAWVEVFNEQMGWVAFDPTPSAAGSAQSMAFDVFLKRIDSLRMLWDIYIVAFDYERQRDVWTSLGEGFRRLAVPTNAALVRVKGWPQPLVVFGVLVILVILLGKSRWGRKWRLQLKLPSFFRRARLYDRPEAAVRFYEDLLRRLERYGFSKPPGMTPAEFAGAMEERLPGLTELTGLYYRVRFGGAILPRQHRIRVDRLVTAIQVSAMSMGELIRRGAERPSSR